MCHKVEARAEGKEFALGIEGLGMYDASICHDPCFRVTLRSILRIQCFVAYGDSQNHPWKRLMLRAWDVLHLYYPIPYYIS